MSAGVQPNSHHEDAEVAPPWEEEPRREEQRIDEREDGEEALEDEQPLDDGYDEDDDEPDAWPDGEPMPDIGQVPSILVHGQAGIGGGPVAGRDINYNLATQRAPIFGPVDDSAQDRMAETYVKVDAFDRLRERLRQHRVQVLQGAQGTGRTTTALLALRALGKPVHHLDPLDELQPLAEPGLPGGFGYAMELTWRSPDERQPLGPGLLHGIRQHLRSVDAYLVIVTADRVGTDGIAGDEFIVPCSPPPATEVFQRHLNRTDDAVRQGICQLLEDKETAAAIDEEVRQATGPAMVVDLIENLANAVRDGRTREQIVNGLHSRLHAGVTRWLLGESSGVTAVDPHRTVWDVATLIACCVLDRYPLSRVLAAAEPLAARLHGVESPGTRPPRPVLHDSVQACAEFIRIAEPSEPWPDWYSRWHTPRVQVLDQKLLKAVLEVVWRRLGSVREPIVSWLGDLAAPVRRARSHGRQVARSLQALGVLAQIDFDHVHRKVLGPWASSGNERLNAAAVEVLAFALKDRRTTSTVRFALRQGSREDASPSRRRTALLAYSAFSADIPADDVLRAVRNMGADGAGPHAVRAIAALMVQRRGNRVLTQLAARVEASDPQALELFMALSGAGDGTDLPDLRAAFLSASSSSAARQVALARLWASGLQDPSTTAVAWRRLRDWVALADHQPELLEPLGALLSELMREPRLLTRLPFVLQLWHGDHDPPERAALLLLERVART